MGRDISPIWFNVVENPFFLLSGEGWYRSQIGTREVGIFLRDASFIVHLLSYIFNMNIMVSSADISLIPLERDLSSEKVEWKSRIDLVIVKI